VYQFKECRNKKQTSSAASSVNFCTKFRCTAIKNSIVDISSVIKNASVYTSYTNSESSGIKNKPILTSASTGCISVFIVDGSRVFRMLNVYGCVCVCVCVWL